MKPLKDIPTSVRDRFKRLSVEQDRSYNLLINLFCRERFLYRLSISKYNKNFLLKGGLLLLNAVNSLVRPTKDIDLLGLEISNDITSLNKIVSEICDINVEDGVTFDLQNMTGVEITKAGGYPGIRLKFRAYIGKSWFPMQIDFGFGDVVFPGPVEFEYPTLLDFPAPRLMAYTFESIIAEKFEAMCSLGLGNSRTQDFYDLYILAQNISFEMPILGEAIRQTFTVRDTDLELSDNVFDGSLADDPVMQARWRTYMNRPGIKVITANFIKVVVFITQFLRPVVQSIGEAPASSRLWHPGKSAWEVQ